MSKPIYPQALSTNLHNRIQKEDTALYNVTAPVRGTKRTKTVVNYAEFEDNADFYMNDDNDAAGGEGPHSANAPIQRDFQHPVGKLAVKTPHVEYSLADIERSASFDEVLIPIRIDLEYSGNKIQDFFMWNLNDVLMTPEQFASIMVQDLSLPTSFTATVAASIKAQIDEYQMLARMQLPKDSDVHVIINLTCNLSQKVYEDNFEWDLTEENTLSPEQFASTVVADLGLTLEFLPAISHALHEALLRVKKDWYEGNLAHEVENQAAFGYVAGIRLDERQLGLDWCPRVEILSQFEIEKREIEKERNLRRLKRESAKLDDKYRRRGNKRRLDDLETTLRL